jgi:hypothetical protein
MNKNDKTIGFKAVSSDVLKSAPATCNLDIRPMKVKTGIKAGACITPY